MSYSPKDSAIAAQALKVQELVVNFSILGNATPASVAISRSEPGFVFLKTEGVDQITAALDSGDGSPTLAAANDANCVLNVLIKLNEQVAKVCGAVFHKSNGAENVPVYLANTTGITALGDKIVLNLDGATALNTGNTLAGCLVVRYVAAE